MFTATGISSAPVRQWKSFKTEQKSQVSVGLGLRFRFREQGLHFHHISDWRRSLSSHLLRPGQEDWGANRQACHDRDVERCARCAGQALCCERPYEDV